MALLFALNVLSAVAAFVAAGFWFVAGRSPARPNPTWDGSLGKDFEGSLSDSAKWNRRAALSAGVAAVLQGIAALLR